MDINCYTILHYGSHYVGYSLQSIYKVVDDIRVFYTPTPTHGSVSGSVKLPDSESLDNLKRVIAQSNTPIKFYKMATHSGAIHEGLQRDAALKSCSDADVTMVSDYDEIWPTDQLEAAIEYIKNNRGPRNWLVNMKHFWRSFDWVCHDNNWPVRFIDHDQQNGVGYIPKEILQPLHFGYAIPSELLLYKISIHGHRSEFRDHWYTDKWLAWPPPSDTHPTNSKDFWIPEPFDKTTLPDEMHSHPFFSLERID